MRKSTIYIRKMRKSTIFISNLKFLSTNLHFKQTSSLQSTPFKGLKSYLQSTNFSAHLSTIYKQNLGQIYNLHLGIPPVTKEICIDDSLGCYILCKSLQLFSTNFT